MNAIVQIMNYYRKNEEEFELEPAVGKIIIFPPHLKHGVRLNESRNEALQRMMADAHSRGANAIVNVRFATSNVAAGASELFCYGTAVVVQ